jgi:hypothetical protein
MDTHEPTHGMDPVMADKQAGGISPQPVAELPLPTSEMAAKFLHKVDYFQGFEAQKMEKTHGVTLIRILGMEDACRLLEVCSQIFGQDAPAQRIEATTIYLVELFSLAQWIEETLGDKELAEAMRKELGEKPTSDLMDDFTAFLRAHLKPVAGLVKQRLDQCKESMSKATAAEINQ